MSDVYSRRDELVALLEVKIATEPSANEWRVPLRDGPDYGSIELRAAAQVALFYDQTVGYLAAFDMDTEEVVVTRGTKG